MMSDWPIKTLDDVCLKITDGAHNSPKTVTDGKPMASVKDLTRFGVDLTEARLIADDEFQKLVKQGCMPEVGDVLIAKDGNSALDTVCNIKKQVDTVLLSSVAILRPDPDQIDSDFLKYYFSSKANIDYLKSNFISGAAIPRVVLKDFKKAEIKLPPLPVQKDIASILNSLDDKIELNRQINQTLEQIAQAIFKSWFVDFEPVKTKIAAKQNGLDIERAAMRVISGKTDEELDQLSPDQRQQLATTAAFFPDELEDSELGEIPKGWEWKSFGDVVENFDSKRIPLSKKQRQERKGNYPYYGAASLMDYVDDYIFDGTYVLMAEDGTVMDKDGYPTTQYIWGKFWVNNHAHILKGVGSVSNENILLYLNNTMIAPYVTGAVQLKINQRNMNSMPFLKADDEVHTCFSELIKPLYSSYQVRHDENLSLSGTRDNLLPKLLSGQLAVA